ncbi:MBOAT family protein [Pontibacter sp. G13]|uniref:MBOAT family O-acyltransferase n=1 Tax=Pontibacter sp. G13 TaxID=3074898 RepID=UPI00288B3716|nr:MBOAT family protein [Pontibacter sp. G13]WNJ19765.1 MBOAT family protein [Pontibacter sp. G13]
MLFNSFEFALFLPAVFMLYWFVFQRNLNVQNLLLVAVSYVFYGWWDWRFLGLLALSSACDYVIGRAMSQSKAENQRKALLGLSLAINLGILGFFKYYNFFVDSFIDAFNGLGLTMNTRTLNIILPVGISFYTFQTLSYTIDIYRGKLKPADNPITFFAFVSFFPQLVAGPIERATHLLPQFEKPRKFDYEKAKDGARQALWGFFKKVVIADTCATQVDYIFNNSETLPGVYLIIGAILFAFQIYGDFSGYSDIAIGTARFFGFDLMQNFNLPYFSRDIAEFWRRWHNSLSTWFRDYLYIPLGGSRGGKWMRLRNVIIIFTVSGFWHGANWTFVVWGFLNGLYYIPLMLANRNRVNVTDTVAEGRFLPNLRELWQMATTFALAIIAWVFFRAESVGHALGYLKRMLTLDGGFEMPPGSMITPLLWVGLLVGIEWLQRTKKHGFQFDHVPMPIRWATYVITTIMVFQAFSLDKTFIYFQF